MPPHYCQKEEFPSDTQELPELSDDTYGVPHRPRDEDPQTWEEAPPWEIP